MASMSAPKASPAALISAYVTLLGAVIGEDLPDAQMRQFELMRGAAGLLQATLGIAMSRRQAS